MGVERYVGVPNIIGVDSAYAKTGVASFRPGVLDFNLKQGYSVEEMMRPEIIQEGLHQPFVARTFKNEYEDGEHRQGELILGDCERDKAVHLAITIKNWIEAERIDFQSGIQNNLYSNKSNYMDKRKYMTKTDRTIVIVESPREMTPRGWGNPTSHNRYAFANGVCVGLLLHNFEVLLKHPVDTPLKKEARSLLSMMYPPLKGFLAECKEDEIDALMCIFWYLWKSEDKRIEAIKEHYQIG